MHEGRSQTIEKIDETLFLPYMVNDSGKRVLIRDVSLQWDDVAVYSGLSGLLEYILASSNDVDLGAIGFQGLDVQISGIVHPEIVMMLTPCCIEAKTATTSSNDSLEGSVSQCHAHRFLVSGDERLGQQPRKGPRSC